MFFSSGDKIVLKNFKNIKDESPNIIDIDTKTGTVRQISKDHDSFSLKNSRTQLFMKVMQTFLPNGYPHSVGENYIRFVTVSNIGAVSFTAMGFLST
jgi:hypothetical protein